MTKTEEKVQIAKQLHLNGYLEYVAKIDEAKELVAMKFPPITQDEIAERLSVIYWSALGDQFDRGLERAGVRLGGMVVSAIPAFVWTLSSHGKVWMLPLIVSASIAAVIYWLMGYEISRMDSIPLDRFTGNLPYGALLAVKEAADRRLGNFVISYPMRRRGKRMQADPIITARTVNGTTVEVFAWDDGKVYE